MCVYFHSYMCVRDLVLYDTHEEVHNSLRAVILNAAKVDHSDTSFHE